ncbi:hypothetical protein RJ640_005490 [Escallonia rubra]|uniref:non-specific serine/threonine protein kinase n=1 Tax=Escallonia rubra TaxID=112253 RepID=A0AA88RJH3_9ASTE|nr:hypothetical protein RJ640_005490 [Escallonia rubra]
MLSHSAEAIRRSPAAAAASITLVKPSPNHKGAFLGNDNCMLRFSSRNMLGSMNAGFVSSGYNANNATNPALFNDVLGNLLGDLRDKAAAGGVRKFAADAVNYTSLSKIYATEQCTPDISEMDCGRCLDMARNGVTIHASGRLDLRPMTFLMLISLAMLDLVMFIRTENGQEVAVKRLSKDSGQGELKFNNEVLLLEKFQQKNLVRLLGFCLEKRERLLNTNPVKRGYLDRNKRYKIIEGVARGLLCLHEDSGLRIIHRDLKSSNVLLGEETNPKITDFGMARLFESDETQGDTSRIVGTYGYMAPEYATHGFGVLVLETVSGQMNNCFHSGKNAEDLLSYVSSIRNILRCIHIGLLCVQENVASRPTMASVVLMLNSFSITLPVPLELAVFMHSSIDLEFTLCEYSSGANDSNQSTSYNVKNETNPVLFNDVLGNLLFDLRERASSGGAQKYAADVVNYTSLSKIYGLELGTVHAGYIEAGLTENGQEVAVKRLSKDSGQGELEFKNEVLFLAKLQHKKLVRLFGFCLEERERDFLSMS